MIRHLLKEFGLKQQVKLEKRRIPKVHKFINQIYN